MFIIMYSSVFWWKRVAKYTKLACCQQYKFANTNKPNQHTHMKP